MAGKSLNKVQLIGNLGKDPEVKYTPQGTPVAKITLATNERFKDKDGQWQDRTEWHNVVLWQRLAEIAGEYLKKGGKVYIEGRLQTRSWDDKTSGQKKYMTEVVASDLILLGGRGEGSSEAAAAIHAGRRPEAAATTSTSANPSLPRPVPVRSVTKTSHSRSAYLIWRGRPRPRPSILRYLLSFQSFVLQVCLRRPIVRPAKPQVDRLLHSLRRNGISILRPCPADA